MVDLGPERFVSPSVAKQFWAKHAYEVLVETAGRYNAVLTYSEFAEQVQRRSNLWTKAPLHTWVGPLLTDLAKVSHVRSEPALTSLVVHKDDGSVGAGYDEVLKLSGRRAVDDPLARETHAAATRLECYRHWGADVPPDAEPTMTWHPRERASRTSSTAGRATAGSTTRATPATPRPAARSAAEARRGAVCTTCFVEMPLSGICTNCAD